LGFSVKLASNFPLESFGDFGERAALWVGGAQTRQFGSKDLVFCGEIFVPQEEFLVH
jgi:hypothetical protein